MLQKSANTKSLADRSSSLPHCVPFTWYGESGKGSNSSSNLPSPTSSTEPSSENLSPAKKGSKVENKNYLIPTVLSSIIGFVILEKRTGQYVTTTINSAWCSLYGNGSSKQNISTIVPFPVLPFLFCLNVHYSSKLTVVCCTITKANGASGN